MAPKPVSGPAAPSIESSKAKKGGSTAPNLGPTDLKGKRKRAAEKEQDDEEDEENDDDGPQKEPEWHSESQKAEAKAAEQGDWQAVWSAQANAYYFWNQKTNETTWTNPLQPDAPKDEPPDAGPSTPAADAAHVVPKPNDYGGIDPELAYLDPSLAYGPRNGIVGSQQARFNARTGRFEGADARTPGHVSELERYKRQSAFFFDVNGWEKSTDAEQERRKAAIAAGEDPDAKKHKAPTKTELIRYKERAKEKKRAKQAWLYD